MLFATTKSVEVMSLMAFARVVVLPCPSKLSADVLPAGCIGRSDKVGDVVDEDEDEEEEEGDEGEGEEEEEEEDDGLASSPNNSFLKNVIAFLLASAIC